MHKHKSLVSILRETADNYIITPDIITVMVNDKPFITFEDYNIDDYLQLCYEHKHKHKHKTNLVFFKKVKHEIFEIILDIYDNNFFYDYNIIYADHSNKIIKDIVIDACITGKSLIKYTKYIFGMLELIKHEINIRIEDLNALIIRGKEISIYEEAAYNRYINARMNEPYNIKRHKTLLRKHAKFTEQSEIIHENTDMFFHVLHGLKYYYAKEVINLYSCECEREYNLKLLC